MNTESGSSEHRPRLREPSGHPHMMGCVDATPVGAAHHHHVSVCKGQAG